MCLSCSFFFFKLQLLEVNGSLRLEQLVCSSKEKREERGRLQNSLIRRKVTKTLLDIFKNGIVHPRRVKPIVLPKIHCSIFRNLPLMLTTRRSYSLVLYREALPNGAFFFSSSVPPAPLVQVKCKVCCVWETFSEKPFERELSSLVRQDQRGWVAMVKKKKIF